MNDGATPMWVASQENNVQALQWLFDHGAQEDVRKPDNDGTTPMCIASQENNMEAMQYTLGVRDRGGHIIGLR
tara:strand:- start:455 stop:673 length:219 start_codon:yes stop_codon:yes gene_type:complete